MLLCFCSIIFFVGMMIMVGMLVICFFFQAEDGIRDLVRSRGLGDVYKRQTVLRRLHQHRRLLAVDRDVGERHVHRRVEIPGLGLSLIHI